MPLLERVRRQERARKKIRQQAEPKGRLVEKHVVWDRQRRYVVGQLEARVQGAYDGPLRLLAHLLASGGGHPARNLVPVSYKLLQPLDPNWNAKNVWEPLVAAGLVERKPENRFTGRSAEYRLTEAAAREIASRAPRTAIEAASAGRVNLTSGSASTATARSAKNDENNNPYPTLIRSAMGVLDRGLFFAPAVEAHLDDLRARAALAETAWEQAGRPEEGAAREGFDEAYGRLQNDEAAYEGVLRQGVEPTDVPDVYSYRLAYAVASTGRLIQVGRGLQSCSKRMKAAAYSGVPGARNYDFQACHVHFLIELMEEAGIDASWFVRFADDPTARADWAREAQLPEGAFKRCVLALVNGAGLPRDPRRSDGEVADIIRKATGKAVGDDPVFVMLAWDKLRYVLRPVRRPLAAWHRHLLGPYAKQHAGKGRGGRFIRNRVGMRFYPADYDAEELPRKLPAFVLQGFETALVHTLTSLSERYGFRPLSNEHDGLVTVGEIPDAAVEEAKGLVGVTRGRLLPKPLCSGEDRATLRACCARAGFALPEGP